MNIMPTSVPPSNRDRKVHLLDPYHGLEKVPASDLYSGNFTKINFVDSVKPNPDKRSYFLHITSSGTYILEESPKRTWVQFIPARIDIYASFLRYMQGETYLFGQVNSNQWILYNISSRKLVINFKHLIQYDEQTFLLLNYHPRKLSLYQNFYGIDQVMVWKNKSMHILSFGHLSQEQQLNIQRYFLNSSMTLYAIYFFDYKRKKIQF